MKNSGYKLESLPQRLREQIAGLTPSQAILQTGSAGPRLRQDTKGPNKTEAAFFAYLKTIYPNDTIKEQGITLRLANGLRYTPDVFVKCKDGNIDFYEVKGFMRDDAAAKIKFAAYAFPFWRFYLVTATDRSLRSWHTQHILP